MEETQVKTLRIRIIALMGASILLTVLLALFFQNRALESQMNQGARENLSVLMNMATAHFEGLPEENIEETIQRIAASSGCRVTLVDFRGVVLGDSEASPESMDNHKNRPEIVEAFRSGEGVAGRYSRSLDTGMLYYAKKIAWQGEPHVLRLSYSQAQMKEVLLAGRRSLFLALLTAGFVALLGGVWAARLLVQPLVDLARSAREGTVLALSPGRWGITQEVEDLARGLREFLDKRTEAEEILREERTWLQLILASLPVGVLVVNRGGEIRYANPPLGALLRREPRQGDPFQGLLREPRMVECLEQALRGEAGSESVTLRDEESTCILLQSAPASCGAVAVFQDVTEQHRLEEARRAFVADAGHEFQTPLTVIRAAAELLFERASEEDQQYLQRILDQQERMTELVDDLLLLSRLEAEKSLSHQMKEDMDLAEIAEGAVKSARILPRAEHMQWDLQLPPRAPYFGWREGLGRCLSNLLENAVKYTWERYGNNPGGSIRVSLELREDAWAFSVRDNGVGVPPRLRERIFERFQRGESSRVRGEWGKGGYGLGLAIVKRTAELHGGRILLDPAEEGSSFTLLLPLEKRDPRIS
jgi:two-component system phosphate regulon sensor histidine kinase PhoR